MSPFILTHSYHLHIYTSVCHTILSSSSLYTKLNTEATRFFYSDPFSFIPKCKVNGFGFGIFYSILQTAILLQGIIPFLSSCSKILCVCVCDQKSGYIMYFFFGIEIFQFRMYLLLIGRTPNIKMGHLTICCSC